MFFLVVDMNAHPTGDLVVDMNVHPAGGASRGDIDDSMVDMNVHPTGGLAFATGASWRWRG